MEHSSLVLRVGMSEFVKKNFLDGGTKKPMFNTYVDDFAFRVNEIHRKMEHLVVDSSMSFCKYVFIENFTSVAPSHLRIENWNAHLLRSGYDARTEEELPVLIRWFELPCPLPPAKYLMLILYSREQLLLECKTNEERELVSKEEWSVVSVIALDERVVPPMQPITMFRNALGIKEGGNGVELNRKEYIAATEYWSQHATVR